MHFASAVQGRDLKCCKCSPGHLSDELLAVHFAEGGGRCRATLLLPAPCSLLWGLAKLALLRAEELQLWVTLSVGDSTQVSPQEM